jgi:hypothetical protein
MSEQPKCQRTCRYGHGDLHKIDGVWSFEGVNWEPYMHGDKVVGRLPAPNGNGFTVCLWRCSVCHYVEMSDQDGDQP